MALLSERAGGHDIPNERVDRAIQVTIAPGRLLVDYEVSLAELTLVQDLRNLIGKAPSADRAALFARYGEVTGPLNAKGFLVAVDGKPLDLRYASYDLAIEQHPRYTFHLAAELPARGRLTLRDMNYVASEGTSRLALGAAPGVRVRGYEGPSDIAKVPIRAVWQLSDEEERQTKQVAASFEPSARDASPRIAAVARSAAASSPRTAPDRRLSTLLDASRGFSLLVMIAIAFGLGAAHAIQPGHGKTLIAAASLGEGRAGWWRGAVLALITTATHMASVLLIALGLWLTRETRYEQINELLARGAGFVIAAIGLWRLGRHLAGWTEHDPADEQTAVAGRGLLGLGIAGGIVPCWDAIVLVTWAELLGKLRLGLLLLAAFSLGMAAVLVAVGLVAAQVRAIVVRSEAQALWERRLGIASALVLTALGLYLLNA